MPKYLDLFAGAGGLSEGFTRAGYEPVAHVEMDKAACFTLRTRAAYHWLKKENKLDIYVFFFLPSFLRTPEFLTIINFLSKPKQGVSILDIN